MSLYLGSVSLVDGLNNLAVNINDTSGNQIITDGSHNLLVNVANTPSVSVSGNVYDGDNLLVNVANTPTVSVSGNVYDGNNLKVVQAVAYSSTKVWDSESTAPTDVSQPVGSTYAVSNCTVYGNVSSACVLALQFSVDNDVYYTSQYSCTLAGAGDFGFSVAGCCAPAIRMIVVSGTPTITAYISLA
jgi:hypothetical protein